MRRPLGSLVAAATHGDVTTHVDNQLAPEDLHMTHDEAEELIGDGKASTTVSMSWADKNMGSGHNVFCSVTLTCGQRVENIEAAQILAAELVDAYMPVLLSKSGQGLQDALSA